MSISSLTIKNSIHFTFNYIEELKGFTICSINPQIRDYSRDHGMMPKAIKSLKTK